MRHWFKDQHFRSLLKNTSYLAVSGVIAAVAGIATLAFAGRALGLVTFGILILIASYAQAVNGIAKFQSWQLVIRYGGEALARGDDAMFKRATGFALGLDLLSGFGGMAVGMALLPLIGGWFGLPQEYLILALLYCFLIPIMGASSPSGALRALDRFDLISWQGIVTPISRAVLSGVGYVQGWGLQGFVALWFATGIAGDLFLWFLAWRELKRRNLKSGIRPTVSASDLPGAWRFAIHINLSLSLVVVWGPIARLIVGGLLGPTGAALYRVAASLADSAQKPADLLAKAYYPEVARMDLRTRKPWKLMIRGTALASMIGLISALVVILIGRHFLSVLFGPEFVGAYPVLLVLIIVPLLAMVSFPLPSMLYTLDRPDAPLRARLIGTLIYILIVAPLAWEFGVAGAAAAFVIGYAASVVGLVFQLLQEYRRLPARAASGGRSPH